MSTQGSNGWNTVKVETVSAATGLHRTLEVTFRNLRIEHCGGNVIRFDAEHPPFYVDGSYGTLEDHARQCGGCGRMFSAEYRSERVA